MPWYTAGSGCTTARLSIQGSRGRTQQIASGSTPRPSSQTMASVAVLPDPTTTYWLGASSSRARALTGTTRASSATSNGGGVSAGMVGSEVARVDDAAALRHLEPLAGDQRDDPTVPDVVAVGKELDPARAPASGRSGPGRSRCRSRRRSPGRAGRPRARAAAGGSRPGASRRRRRRSRPGAGGRTDRRRASGRRRCGGGRPSATRTSAWSTSASVNAMPVGAGTTTR